MSSTPPRPGIPPQSILIFLSGRPVVVRTTTVPLSHIALDPRNPRITVKSKR